MRHSEDADERSPLLQFPGSYNAPSEEANLSNAYKHFCHLIGNRPVDLEPGTKHAPPSDSLYYRALHHRRAQGRTYVFTAALTNALLLSQVVLGAALTGLAASDQSRVILTVFGALNTVIAGLVAFLKSRGQPMRARMFSDDLDRVVDEIENSATMWLGISRNIHGYDAIDTEESVTVRSEVARLTRLYDRAVKINTLNDPDFYGTGGPTDPHSAALRSRPLQPGAPAVSAQAPGVDSGVAAVPVPEPAAVVDPDESPATKAPVPAPKDDAKPKDDDMVAKPDDAKGGDDKGKAPLETPVKPDDASKSADGPTNSHNDAGAAKPAEPTV